MSLRIWLPNERNHKMKSLSRTVIALIIFNPAIADTAMAQFADGPITYTISGNAGVGGAVMKGLPDDVVADENGYYSASVGYGWSGEVTPMKEGLIFDPPRLRYPKVKQDLTHQNYDARPVTLTISGSVGVAGVTMTGLPGNPPTDQKGYYVASVDYGWSGTVMPAKEGYAFEPASMSYRKLVRNQTGGNYTAKPIMLTISGRLVLGGRPMGGVHISADSGGGSDTTDAQGSYSLKVPYGWSGKITPFKHGIRFSPPSQPFTNVITNIVDGEPERPKAGGDDPFGDRGSSRSRTRRGSARDADMMYDPYGARSRARAGSGFEPAIRSSSRRVLVIPAGEVKANELAETVEDMHVMSHILDEGFKETRRIQGFFTDFGAFFGRDNRNTEATYLQGFGVLFFMEVNFAFSSPPKKQAEDPAETTETVDSTWLKARRQVLSPGASPGLGQEDSADDYGSQMVEELKRELVKALKHAGNIRNIKPDEWIILTVIGGQRRFGMGFGGGGMMSGGMGGMMGSGMGGMGGGMGGMGGGMGGMMGNGMSGMGGGGFGGGVYGGMAAYGGTTSSSSTVLTIRAKKSDVDDFAKGELDFEQFQEHVQIFMY
jgi:hypothetical protein